MTSSLKALVAAMSMALASSAYADCADDLAKLDGDMSAATTEGISKDGTLAPLQDDVDAHQTDTAAKNDSTSQAMSGQDVEAQQDGQPTAAEQAQTETDATQTETDLTQTEADATQADTETGGDRAAAINDARMALERGDEAACLEALERAKAS